jgi:hypothetical protein
MRIKIAIASNNNFYQKSLPIIIPSLNECGIANEDIHIFIAGVGTEGKQDNNGMTFYQLEHNSYEYSPLIEIIDKQLEADYWFLIHDTCKVGPKFKELLYNIPENKPDKIALRPTPAMSIGLYKYEYLLTVKDKLMGIRNTDLSIESLKKWKHWGVSAEDYILWQTEPHPLIYDRKDNNLDHKDGDMILIGQEDWYKTGIIRRTEYYPALDLYKNKSNWGQSTGPDMIIDI